MNLPQFIQTRRAACDACPHAERVRVSGGWVVAWRSRCNAAPAPRPAMSDLLQRPAFSCPDKRFDVVESPSGFVVGSLVVHSGALTVMDRGSQDTPILAPQASVGGCGGCGK